jgi:hypothetical protein
MFLLAGSLAATLRQRPTQQDIGFYNIIINVIYI